MSSVNFEGKIFLSENISWKIKKMSEFYMVFSRKILFPDLWDGEGANVLCPPSLLRLRNNSK